MARMHSRKKGKSGSHKPYNKSNTWIRYKAKELELLITKLAKEGKSPSAMGVYLRDNYGIPDVKQILKKTLTKVLKEKNIATALPEDLLSLIKRSVQIQKHIDENKLDMTALRGLQLTDSKIRRLVKYYKRNGVLPLDWKYDSASLRLYVE